MASCSRSRLPPRTKRCEMLRRFSGILVAVVTCVAVGIAVAQQSIPPGSQTPVAPSGSTVQGQEVEGKISSLDRIGGTITLDNGQKYIIPDFLNADWTRIQEGTTTKMRYGTDGGRNTATFLEIRR
jgi:uncharacterized protein YjdB